MYLQMSIIPYLLWRLEDVLRELLLQQPLDPLILGLLDEQMIVIQDLDDKVHAGVHLHQQLLHCPITSKVLRRMIKWSNVTYQLTRMPLVALTIESPALSTSQSLKIASAFNAISLVSLSLLITLPALSTALLKI